VEKIKEPATAINGKREWRLCLPAISPQYEGATRGKPERG